MNASMSVTSRSRQWAATTSASAASAVNGFSQRTSNPASAARVVHSPWSPFGSGL